MQLLPLFEDVQQLLHISKIRLFLKPFLLFFAFCLQISQNELGYKQKSAYIIFVVMWP